MTYIYFDDQQWALAEQKLMTLDRAQLCLADSREQAQQIADAHEGRLLDLTKEASI